ncbi:MAG TPA: response regulator [Steroidobacteraceae bacterium]|nr:response regulator [Steroidobacteraceae bacterium]
MAKRALIVDDSRSARVILSRMLEGYGLKVDASESAEQALTFLENERPDVIFMDHLMPGMDGFQAVQAIKSNPATAMIPVIMYTSQEGELYVSQARALGAVGVLPKTVKQADVSRVLYQLRLLPDRRDGREPALMPVELADLTPAREPPPPPQRPAAATNSATADLENAVRQVLTPLLKEQHAELRRWLTAAFDALGVREQLTTSDDVRIEGEDANTPRPPARQVSIPRAWAWPIGLGIALSCIALVVLGLLVARQQADLQQARATNAQLTTRSEQQAQQLARHAAAVQANAQPMAAQSTSPAAASPSEGQPESVPYGEAPLAGARLDRLRQMLLQLRQQGVAGTVRATTYIGDFCLAGNAVEGYALAAEDLQARRCDVIGNPYEDGLRSAQRQSLAFANLVSTTRTETDGRLNVEVIFAGRKPVMPYPAQPPSEKVSAGEWNRIAERNNRVEFAFESNVEAAATTSALH